MRSPIDEALRWLTHAQDEYQDAEDLRERGRFYLALFHFQQVAEKALKELDWQPEVDLEEGISRYIEWYKKSMLEV